MNFQQKLDAMIEKNNSLLCIGIDPVLEKMPKHVQKLQHPFFEFAKDIIDSTHDLVCCYKPNTAFFESRGEQGIGELKKICDYLRQIYPDIPILLDFKRGDIGNTNTGYVQFAFDYLGADAVTLQPYLGKEAVSPFLEKKDKGLFILCKTSNPGSGEFQNLPVILNDSEESYSTSYKGKTLPLYLFVARHIAEEWNQNNNCFLVIGATYPDELKKVRDIVGDMTILAPGLGSQGGEVGALLQAGLNSQKTGLIVNSSREVLYAGSHADFAQKAREKAKTLKDEINKYRNI